MNWMLLYFSYATAITCVKFQTAKRYRKQIFRAKARKYMKTFLYRLHSIWKLREVGEIYCKCNGISTNNRWTEVIDTINVSNKTIIYSQILHLTIIGTQHYYHNQNDRIAGEDSGLFLRTSSLLNFWRHNWNQYRLLSCMTGSSTPCCKLFLADLNTDYSWCSSFVSTCNTIM